MTTRKWDGAQSGCQQGELNIIHMGRCDPSILKQLEQPEEKGAGPRNASGLPIVGHSETGHHHVLSDPSARLIETANPLICYLQLDQPTRLDHLKPGPDQHDTWELPAGRYWVSRQREGGPERWRVVSD